MCIFLKGRINTLEYNKNCNDYGIIGKGLLASMNLLQRQTLKTLIQFQINSNIDSKSYF
jgi:hypothetical protein